MTWFNVIASNLGSACLGFLLCKWLTKRALVAAERATHLEEAPVPARRRMTIRVAIIVVFTLVAFLVGLRTGFALVQREVDCFNEYANGNADAQNRRSSATEALQDADEHQDKAILAVLTPGNDAADIKAAKKATAAKIRKKAELARERRLNPYPDPPREVCP